MGKFFKLAEQDNIEYHKPKMFKNPLLWLIGKSTLLEPDFNSRQISKEYVDEHVSKFMADMPDKDVKVYVNGVSKLDRVKRVLNNNDLSLGDKYKNTVGTILMPPLAMVGDHTHVESKSIFLGTPNPHVTAHEFGHMKDYLENPGHDYLETSRSTPLYTARSERRASDYATNKLGKNVVLQLAYSTYAPASQLYEKVFPNLASLENYLKKGKFDYKIQGDTIDIDSSILKRKFIDTALINEKHEIEFEDGTTIKVKQ